MPQRKEIEFLGERKITVFFLVVCQLCFLKRKNAHVFELKAYIVFTLISTVALRQK